MIRLKEKLQYQQGAGQMPRSGILFSAVAILFD